MTLRQTKVYQHSLLVVQYSRDENTLSGSKVLIINGLGSEKSEDGSQ